MSFILDALSKSEKARRLKKPTAKDGLSAPEPVKPQRVSRRPYYILVAVALLLNGAALIWWLQPRQSDGNDRRAAGERQASQPVKDAAKAVSDRTAGQNVVPEQREATAKPSEAVRERTAALSPHAARKEKEKNQPDRKMPENARAPSEPKPPMANPADVARKTAPPPASKPMAQTASKPASRPADIAAAPAEPAGKTGAKVLGQARVTAAETQPEEGFGQAGQISGSRELVLELKDLTGAESLREKPASGPALKYFELPSHIRDSIPKLSVSMLLFSKKQNERWININGAKMREGQEVSPGLKLQEITPDGAVFTFQGHRFYKAVIGD